MTFRETFLAAFAGGLAAAIVSIVGIIIVEVVRARLARLREERDRREERLRRLRASRNAAVAIRLELFEIARPLMRFVEGISGWEPMHFADTAWADLATRSALIDGVTEDVLYDPRHAYRELYGLAERTEREGERFLNQLARDDGKLGKAIVAEHVWPALERLNLAVAEIETHELVARGQLQAEAARTRNAEEAARTRKAEEPASPP